MASRVTTVLTTLSTPPRFYAICVWCDWGRSWETMGAALVSAHFHAKRHGIDQPIEPAPSEGDKT